MGRIIPYIMEILVNGKDYFMENKSHVPNHQPAIIGGEMSMVIDKLYIYVCNVLRYVLNRCNHGDYQMVNY